LSKMWPRWNDPRFILCVLNNRDLAEVSWEQRENDGAPRFAASQALPDFRYSAYAQLLGLEGILVDEPGQLAEAWDAALAADRPVVL
ncbi:thiamine pyrophosphate-dependent enzyme, partial [Rhizobium ruizarguesonis]